MTAKTNQKAWIDKVTMLLYQEIVQNGKLRKTLWPSNIQKRFHSQMLAKAYNPLSTHQRIHMQLNTDPSSIFKTSSTLGQKIRLPVDFKTKIEYLKLLPDTTGYIRWNHSRKSSSSSCTFRWNTSTKKLLQNKKNETTIPNAESTIQSAASNDVNNDDNEIEMHTMSNKRISMKIVLKRTPPILFQQKRLPLAPQLVSSLAPVCQKGGEGEIYLRSLPSLPTLLNLEDGGPVREISLR